MILAHRSWEHNIVSYEFSVVNHMIFCSRSFIDLTCNIISIPLLRITFHEPLYNVNVAFRKASNWQSSPKPPLLGCNRLVLNLLWTYCSLRLEFIGYNFSKLLFHTYTTGTWFLLVLDSLTDYLSVLLESSSIQLGLPQKIGVLEQMATLIFWPYLQSAF